MSLNWLRGGIKRLSVRFCVLESMPFMFVPTLQNISDWFFLCYAGAVGSVLLRVSAVILLLPHLANESVTAVQCICNFFI